MVVISVPALWEIESYPGLTPLEQIGAEVFLTALTAVLGLTVYGLSRLARLAVQLEALRGDLARSAVLGERLRVSRDTHDLLGLGLSAIALKADLIIRLIGRDDSRARGEIAELARICATARTDIRLVTGEAAYLPLDAELMAAQQLLASVGIDVRADIAAMPVPAAAGAVLVPVLREAVTNILRHSGARNASIETAAGPACCGCTSAMTASPERRPTTAPVTAWPTSPPGSRPPEAASPASAPLAGSIWSPRSRSPRPAPRRPR